MLESSFWRTARRCREGIVADGGRAGILPRVVGFDECGLQMLDLSFVCR